MRHPGWVGLLALVAGCGTGAHPMAPAPAHALVVRQTRGLTPEQRHRAEALTSLFENGTLALQYGYAEQLGDGRGITAGRAGFTSGTGDMLLVVQAYTDQVATHPLARYMPRLKQINAGEVPPDTVTGLEGLEPAWADAAADARFRAAQDAVVDRLYYDPAMAHADALGVASALGRAVLYDTIIQHGDGDDLDGLPALIARTGTQVQGDPAHGVAEKRWLKAFLAMRRADLLNPYDPATQAVWAESVGRVDALASILVAGNMALRGPFRLHAGGYDIVVP